MGGPVTQQCPGPARAWITGWLWLAWLACGVGPVTPARAQFHLMTGENHGELRWRTLASEHFRIHYPEGLEQTARDCAAVAEQVYGPVTAQLGVEPRHPSHLTITDSDQIVNGFAMPGRMAIWVHQNDYMRHFSQNRDWLRQVIAHEFQHLVAFEALRDWRGLAGLALSGTPAWWLEGLAEYYTENWNTLRSDRDLRAEALDGRLEHSDPHDAGYSRVLYLAWRDGDSTLVRICRWRHPRLGTHDFKRAFREVTGQSVADFESEWSRVVATLYHAELAAGEPLRSIGERLRLGLADLRWFTLLPDSSAWLAIGRRARSETTLSLYRIPCRPDGRAELLCYGGLKGWAALAPDGRALVVDRWSPDPQQSLLSDLWEIPLETNRRPRRLTRGARAQDPALAPDGTLACITSRGDRHRLELQAPGDTALAPFWDPGPGWQLQTPVFSPDGRRIALAVDDPDQHKRILVLERATGQTRLLGQPDRDQRLPLWLDDSTLVCTVFHNHGSQLLRLLPSGREEPVTASGEGLWLSSAVAGQPGSLLALALDSAETSRPLRLDGWRTPDEQRPVIREAWRAWREHGPGIRVPDTPPAPLELDPPRPYRSLALRPMLLLPLPGPEGLMGLGVFSDPRMVNTLLVAGGNGAGPETDPGLVIQWENRSLDWTLALVASRRWQPVFSVYNGRLVERWGSSLEGSARRQWSGLWGPGSRLALSAGLKAEDLPATGLEPGPGPLPLPPSGSSGRLLLEARLAWAPLDRESALWPAWAHGLRVGGQFFRPALGGEERLDYLHAAVYRIQPTPVRALKLVLEARLHTLARVSHSSRSLGLSPDPLLDPLLVALDPAGRDGSPLGPKSRLRGLGRELAGDRVATATAELRFSLGNPALVRLGPLRNGRLNLAAFGDLGRVSGQGRLQPGSPGPETLWTSGLETQLVIQAGSTALLALAGGYGGEALDWLDHGDAGRWYWGIHLGRPF